VSSDPLRWGRTFYPEQTRLESLGLVAKDHPRQPHPRVDDALSPDFPLGDAVETFIRREEAERFIEEVRGDEPETAAKLRIEERELEAGGLN
jgi:hypothetical protein